ncbi:ATP-grasp domain-containing protein [Nakamurella endophytica]|uniref:ATP-grasp domain-containing protein n=1 Tax=Nakamurella endophytica TaxID=1748367 RepID=A0A917SUX9_9ACTN|nr:ATP-grasp domain-containing protein [Nakamurella endophytica]GGL97316.1 hypothetical protein GCM10011594_16290 [Nakamurella endophytica]
MPGVRIWLNRNYGTSVHLARQLRANPAGTAVELFGSHPDPASPLLAECDQVLPEPEPGAPGSVDLAVELCRRHRIDVFLPVAGQEEYAERQADFAAVGTALLCSPPAAVRVLADKADTYTALHGSPLVPPWRPVRSVADFDRACRELAEHRTPDAPLVIKPARAVGADGVRYLTTDPPGLGDLLGQVDLAVPAAGYRAALAAADPSAVPLLLVSAFLPAPETSVDVLADHGTTVVAVPRSKDGRRRWIGGDPELVPLAAELVARWELHGLVNVQFRSFRGRPALLEVNTRPAGGMYQSELAGVNLSWAAVELALGRRPAVPRPRLGREYRTVSSVVGVAGQRLSLRTRSTTPLTKDSTAASAWR